MPDERGYSRHPFGKGSRHAGFGRRQHPDYKLNCLAWQIQFAQALLATNPQGSLAILAAAEIAVFQRLWESAADQDASGPFCAPVFSSVEKQAYRRVSSLSERR